MLTYNNAGLYLSHFYWLGDQLTEASLFWTKKQTVTFTKDSMQQ